MLDSFLDCFAELLTQLNFRAGFADIRKNVRNPVLRILLYGLSVAGMLLFAALLAMAIVGVFALFECFL